MSDGEHDHLLGAGPVPAAGPAAIPAAGPAAIPAANPEPPVPGDGARRVEAEIETAVDALRRSREGDLDGQLSAAERVQEVLAAGLDTTRGAR